MKTVSEHEVIVHGVEHMQHFQGCGICHTQYDDVGTGIGVDAAEAYEDALEQLAQSDWDVDDADSWDDKPDPRDAVLPYDAHDELWVYVSVRVKG